MELLCVDPNEVEAVIDHLVTGTRHLPSILQTAMVYRLELPKERFERRIQLPAERYRRVGGSSVDGCVLIVLEKIGVSRG